MSVTADVNVNIPMGHPMAALPDSGNSCCENCACLFQAHPSLSYCLSDWFLLMQNHAIPAHTVCPGLPL